MNPFRKKEKQIGIFITAGFPKIDSLFEQITILENSKIDFIEVGIPFSDPLADGPTIQRSSEVGIENGMSLRLLLTQLESIKTNKPIVLMGYLNSVLHFGLEDFLCRCQKLGISSVILPDLSFEIYERDYRPLFEKYGVGISFIITTRTPSEKIEKIAKASANSFVYLVSANATTGGNDYYNLGNDHKAIYHLIKDTPMMIGFGIKDRDSLIKAQNISDGAIIGSAYIQAVSEGKELKFLDEITQPVSYQPQNL